jgi:hypothetical protein
MTFPKKKIRLITIDAIKYHWMVRGGVGYCILIVEKQE